MWAYGTSKALSETIARQNRQGADLSPSEGVERLEVPIPSLRAGEVLVKPVASALNYNSIWSSRGYPVTPFQLVHGHVSRNKRDDDHLADYCIFGSDAAGVICEVGPGVEGWQVGDEVILHCNVVDDNDPIAKIDSLKSETQSIWGYETNFGAFAEYCKVKSNQLIRRPASLSWEEAASFSLTLSTAFRMLISSNGAQLHAGETVLVWGGAGGLGVFAIQLAKAAGCKVVAIVSSESKRALCEQLGADFVVNRTTDGFNRLVDEQGKPNYIAWKKAKTFLARNGFATVDVVFEHVGRSTLGFSIYVCKRGGRIVTCAASSGFMCDIDLRYLWMQVKSLIGSHFASYEEAKEAAEWIGSGKVRPVVHSVNDFSQLGARMDEMSRNETFGKIVFRHAPAMSEE